MVNSLAEKNQLGITWNNGGTEFCEFVFDKAKAGYVYLMKAEGSNRVKIGYSKNPERRLLEIQSPQAPFKLELVHKILVADCIIFEKFLHNYYKDFRVFGEWFEIPLIVDEYKGVCVNITLPSGKQYKQYKTDSIDSVILEAPIAEFIEAYLKPIAYKPFEDFCIYLGCEDYYPEIKRVLDKQFICFFSDLFFIDRLPCVDRHIDNFADIFDFFLSSMNRYLDYTIFYAYNDLCIYGCLDKSDRFYTLIYDIGCLCGELWHTYTFAEDYHLFNKKHFWEY